MIESRDYPVTVRWTTGRQSAAESTDGLPALRVSAPPEFGGEPGIWSPEHLFVTSVASCFLTTFLAIAELSQLEVLALEVEASGHLERDEERRYRFSEVVLRPQVTLVREQDRARAERIAAKGEEHCLISRSIRCAVRLEPRFEAASAAGVVAAVL
jgi:peroxiredoxin-like protein